VIVQPSAAAATRPSDAASASTTKSSRRACRPGAKKLQDFDQAGEGDDEGGRERPVARVGQPESQPQQHEGKRMLAVLPQVRVGPLFRRPERRKGNGGGDACG
jgi:hypothetical protein